MKKLKKTRIVLEVLSSVDDSPQHLDLTTILEQSNEGAFSLSTTDETEEIIEGDEAVEAACKAQGTDVEFFFPEVDFHEIADNLIQAGLVNPNEMEEEFYYDIQIWHDRKNSYSVPYSSQITDEAELIKDAVFSGHLESEDAMAVSQVVRITKEEYEILKNV